MSSDVSPVCAICDGWIEDERPETIHAKCARTPASDGSLDVLAAKIAKDWNGRIITGDDIRAAIDKACSLTNPRLSEVEWDEVAAALRVARTPAATPTHDFVAPNNARPTLCAYVYSSGEVCDQPRGHPVHVRR